MTTLSPPPPLKARFRGHRGAVISLGLAPAPSPVSKPAFFASGSEDGSCRVWDVETGKATRGFTFQNTSFGPNEKLPATSVCFGDGGNALYCSRGNSVHVFDLRSQTAMIIGDTGRTFGEAADEINQIAINDKNTFFATADDSGAVQVLDIRSNYRPFKRFRSTHANICSAVTFRPTSPWDLWSGSFDYTVRRWDFSRGSVVEEFNLSELPEDRPILNEEDKPAVGNPAFVNGLAFDSSGARLACAKGDGEIEVIERSGGKWKRTRSCALGIPSDREVKGHTWSATKVAWVPTEGVGRTLVSGGLDGRCILWDLGNGSGAVKCHSVIQTGHKVDALAVFSRGQNGLGILVGGPCIADKETKEEKHGDILFFST